jgi:hypothetical protein
MPPGARRLSLLLPGLVPGAGPLAQLPAPLSRLLARAEWQTTSHSTTTALLSAFAYPADCGLAPLMAVEDLDLPSGEGWLRADPVHLRADAKLVMLMAPAPGDPGDDEATDMLQGLTAALPECEWRRGRHAGRWYARVPTLDATPRLGPAWLNGRSLTPFFPQDAAHRSWRRLTSEAQMVMHGAPANARREARGAITLNALWLWGGGPVVRKAGSVTPAAVFGTDLLLAGAARACAVGRHPRPDAGAAAAALARGPVVVVCGAPYGVADAGVPESAIVDDAAAWAALAWQLMRSGRADAIELLGEGLRGQLTPAARFRFWRRPTVQFGDPHAVGETG